MHELDVLKSVPEMGSLNRLSVHTHLSRNLGLYLFFYFYLSKNWASFFFLFAFRWIWTNEAVGDHCQRGYEHCGSRGQEGQERGREKEASVVSRRWGQLLYYLLLDNKKVPRHSSFLLKIKISILDIYLSPSLFHSLYLSLSVSVSLFLSLSDQWRVCANHVDQSTYVLFSFPWPGNSIFSQGTHQCFSWVLPALVFPVQVFLRACSKLSSFSQTVSQQAWLILIFLYRILLALSGLLINGLAQSEKQLQLKLKKI